MALSTARAETIRLTTGRNDPPFTDDTLPDGGVATHLVMTVFRTMGVEPKLDWLPWRRGYELAGKGVYLATFPYLKTAERQREFLYSEPIFSDDSYLWSRKGAGLDVARPEGFFGRTLCIPRGFVSPLNKLLKAQIEHHEVKVEMPDSPERCVQMLAAGRIDVFSGQLAEISGYVAKMGLTDSVERSSGPIMRLDFHVIFSKADRQAPAMLDRFNKTLRKMREDGSYDRLVAF